MKLLHEQNKKVLKLTEENKKLKNVYEDLCLGYDNLKKLIHDMSVRQGKHIETCDRNFLQIKNNSKKHVKYKKTKLTKQRPL